ncbi:MAG: DUF5683 domain-containing protein [Chitinophagales bacterium]|nr:DUF5683 domain-containing protein [Chitinophagales bacterium]MDW8427983.1 DUF5683 domain-containing protein [Chitinophagales bacterium]
MAYVALVALFLFFSPTKLKGQQQPPAHSPLKAGIASAILPGAGQLYNQKYWKVPLIYTALATSAFFIYYNGNIFFSVRKNLNARVRGDSVPQPQFINVNNIFSQTTVDLNQFSYNELIQIQEDYRKYFTLSCIAMGATYLLNILDAVVDAHLFEFDVSDDLSVRTLPVLYASRHPGSPFTAEINITLRLP